MKIMDLILGDRRSLKHGESCVREDRLMRLPRRPVFARHLAVVRGCSAPRETIALVIGSHAMKTAGPRELAFKVINVRELHVRHSRLIVIPIPVEPWNGIRARAAIRWLVILRDRRRTALHRSADGERH